MRSNERSVLFRLSCQEKQLLTRVNQEKISSEKVCSKTNVTVIWVNLNKVNSRTHIEQQIELFGNEDNIFQLQNEIKTSMTKRYF